MKNFRWQVAGNVQGNCLSVELIDEYGDVFADISRCDGPNALTLNTFGNDIDLGIVEAFIRVARERLECFEDGSLLTEARTNQRFTTE